MAKRTKKNIVSVLAFEKKLVTSDGYMYGTTWEKRGTPGVALKLIEKSVRGTISNRLKKALQADPAKLDAEVKKPNLHTVDCCALGLDQDTLKLHFTLKILSGVENPSACNNEALNKTYKEAAKAYIKTENFTELAMRYANNIANARFLWRNRVGAENIEVKVKSLNKDFEKEWIFDAALMSTRKFEENDPMVNSLAEKIAATLSGKTKFLLLEVNAYVQVGKFQEVYPSQELVFDKGNAKSKKSKILYDIDGIAGMHSQKIGNALRTIDTWYPEFGDADIGPIAIEPYGAVTNLGKAYRHPKTKNDFYTLFDKFACGKTLETKDEEHYVMATLVRGGIFSKSCKE